ncbi:PAS domain S-box-containing protein/diguanylate cyclase (GGDEF) domain-containing protein [Rhodospira trueperi]|uniref:diguanylate cyclase n=2 Tax=Rhodospira trueperi TaxID=69960 RepID=A0A1G7H1G6_9PROT|nr:PAS domain S-box-containing protein/diguanylate cyclase (GGDEF) domain-containing protein [Rhodospira trueperi]
MGQMNHVTDGEPFPESWRAPGSTEAMAAGDPTFWTVLVVGIEPEVHAVTETMLDRATYAGQPVRLLHARSVLDAEAALRSGDDIAVILLDVEMETQDTGLRLVRTIRETLGIEDTRIVLRTGQPGDAPDADTVLRYDINDYRARTELTDVRLFSVIVAALRAYDRLRTIATQRDALGQMNQTLELRIAERTQELQDSETRLRSILETSVLPIFITAASGGQVLYANKSAHRLLGLVETRCDDDIWHRPADRRDLLNTVGQSGSVHDVEAQMIAVDGHRFWALIAAVAMTFDGQPAVLISLNDISSRKAMEEELKRLAATDALTGIGNRRQLMELGDRELRRARRYGGPLSVLILDIDHFKHINDTHGHALGDEALKTMVTCCLQQLREIDIMCRLGGEEFVVLMPETPVSAARTGAERLREKVAALKIPLTGDETLSFTISIGLTEPHQSDDTLGDVLMRADEALYAAKREGRNRVVVR